MPKSKSKSITKSKIIQIPHSIEKLLKTSVTKLKNVLKDNHEFAEQLVQKLLLIYKEVSSREISDLIFAEYPALDEEASDYDKNKDEVNTDKRQNLFSIAGDLGHLIQGDHPLTTAARIKHPKKEWDKYNIALRDKIEHEVHDIFFSQKNSNVDIIGESE
jgi:hypothetical protein